MLDHDLFNNDKKDNAWQPLAARIRPLKLDQYIGQQHLLGEGQILRLMIDLNRLHSMIFWGPPGVGKTSLAKILSKECRANFVSISAVLSGVKEIRKVIDSAQYLKKMKGIETVLFVDEVHRLNKGQQDVFLPFVEDGTIVFIGATTENPSFELNNALLSRARVYVLKSLSVQELDALITIALIDPRSGLSDIEVQISNNHRQQLIQAADGDARRLLNLIEISVDLAKSVNGQLVINDQVMALLLQRDHNRFDKGGDLFYDHLSAFHKSVRGSHPDAALYWTAKMVDGGIDPFVIIRRLVAIASEDIGNADPRALSLVMNAWQSYERLGSPEGLLALGHAVVYCACAPKSNAVYKAWKAALNLVKSEKDHPVPVHLRQAPTKLTKSMGYGKNYRYTHDEPEAYAAGESYFPEALRDQQFYFPSNRGLEKKIKDKLAYLKNLDQQYT